MRARPGGSGALLWFETDDFDSAIARATEMGAEVIKAPHRNPSPGETGGPQHRECWFRDLDGYTTGGWQEARRQRVAELLAEHPGSFGPDQYHNPDNVAGYAPLALELIAQLGRVDVLVCSVGTGGHSAGVSRALREFFPHLRLVGVDTVGSTIFGQPARTRLMRGLGSSIYPRNIDYPAFDEVHWVAPGEAVRAARLLAGAQYASGGWSVGAVALVAGWLARTEEPDVRIAAVFPDGPQRYFDTVFNDDYCHRHGGHVPHRRHAGRPPGLQAADRGGLRAAYRRLRAVGRGDSVPALIAATAAIGFAGALFNPAVRAYLAHDAGQRRVEAFALFNIFYQTGILLGPLLGLALTGVDFRLTCAVAAGVFAVLSVAQLRALPQRRGCDTADDRASSVLTQWRSVLGNRSFVLFSIAMIGSYVLAFQVYLALPLEVRRLAGSGVAGTVGVAALFAVSGLLTIAGQMRITAWCRNRWGPGRCLMVGLGLMAASFLPPLATATAAAGSTTPPTAVLLAPLVLSAALLALGTIIVFPFEMDTIVTLSDNRLVATHYGLYNTLCGIGIMLGNLLTGIALDLGRAAGLPALPWLALAGIGLLCAAGVGGLDRAGRLQRPVSAVTSA